MCNDIANDPESVSWRGAALERNYRAMASLPLKQANHVIGTFNLYAVEKDFFDDTELRLLDELALDISFALEVGRQARERQAAVDELRLKRRSSRRWMRFSLLILTTNESCKMAG